MDDKVAKFADQLLIDHKDNKRKSGTSRHDSDKNLGNWASELGYQTDQDFEENPLKKTT